MDEHEECKATEDALYEEIARLEDVLKRVENCLVCGCIADPAEVIENSLEILNKK